MCGLLERAMNSAWPSFHYRPDWSVSKRQEGAGHGSTVAQVSWARGGKSCQSNWTYLLPIQSPRLAHVCCANLGSGSLYETDSAGAASFCMPLFTWPRQEWIFNKIVSMLFCPHQCNCACTLQRRKKAVCLIWLQTPLEMVVKLCQIFGSAISMTLQKFNIFKQCLNEHATLMEPEPLLFA